MAKAIDSGSTQARRSVNENSSKKNTNQKLDAFDRKLKDYTKEKTAEQSRNSISSHRDNVHREVDGDANRSKFYRTSHLQQTPPKKGEIFKIAPDNSGNTWISESKKQWAGPGAGKSEYFVVLDPKPIPADLQSITFDPDGKAEYVYVEKITLDTATQKVALTGERGWVPFAWRDEKKLEEISGSSSPSAANPTSAPAAAQPISVATQATPTTAPSGSADNSDTFKMKPHARVEYDYFGLSDDPQDDVEVKIGSDSKFVYNRLNPDGNMLPYEAQPIKSSMKQVEIDGVSYTKFTAKDSNGNLIKSPKIDKDGNFILDENKNFVGGDDIIFRVRTEDIIQDVQPTQTAVPSPSAQTTPASTALTTNDKAADPANPTSTTPTAPTTKEINDPSNNQRRVLDNVPNLTGLKVHYDAIVMGADGEPKTVRIERKIAYVSASGSIIASEAPGPEGAEIDENARSVFQSKGLKNGGDFFAISPEMQVAHGADIIKWAAGGTTVGGFVSGVLAGLAGGAGGALAGGIGAIPGAIAASWQGIAVGTVGGGAAGAGLGEVSHRNLNNEDNTGEFQVAQTAFAWPGMPKGEDTKINSRLINPLDFIDYSDESRAVVPKKISINFINKENESAPLIISPVDGKPYLEMVVSGYGYTSVKIFIPADSFIYEDQLPKTGG